MARPFLFRCDFPFFVVRPSGRMIKKGKYIRKCCFSLDIPRNAWYYIIIKRTEGIKNERNRKADRMGNRFN